MNLEIGDKVEFISPYIDGTVKLHERFYGMRKGRVETAWKILGRDTSHYIFLNLKSY